MNKCRKNIITSHFHHQQKDFMESCNSSHICGLRYTNHSNSYGLFGSYAIPNRVRTDLNIQSDPSQSVTNLVPSKCYSSKQFLQVKCAASSYDTCESVVWRLAKITVQWCSAFGMKASSRHPVDKRWPQGQLCSNDVYFITNCKRAFWAKAWIFSAEMLNSDQDSSYDQK